jgi:hypothetical protein
MAILPSRDLGLKRLDQRVLIDDLFRLTGKRRPLVIDHPDDYVERLGKFSVALADRLTQAFVLGAAAVRISCDITRSAPEPVLLLAS